MTDHETDGAKPPAEPSTDEEWQGAVDAAYAWLVIDAARKYGLVTGGPEVNVDRCEAILAEGGERGWSPTADAIEKLLTAPAAPAAGNGVSG